jgi:hypothetical protein
MVSFGIIRHQTRNSLWMKICTKRSNRDEISFSSNFGGKLQFHAVFLFFSWPPPLLLHIFSLLLPVQLGTMITLEPLCTECEFQHFILRFNKIYIYIFTWQIPLKERIRGESMPKDRVKTRWLWRGKKIYTNFIKENSQEWWNQHELIILCLSVCACYSWKLSSSYHQVPDLVSEAEQIVNFCLPWLFHEEEGSCCSWEREINTYLVPTYLPSTHYLPT